MEEVLDLAINNSKHYRLNYYRPSIEMKYCLYLHYGILKKINKKSLCQEQHLE